MKQKPLAIPSRKHYAVRVPEKKGNEFGDSNHTKAHRPRNAAFLRAYVIAFSKGGSGGDTFGYAGSFGVRFANPVICCPPVWRRAQCNHTPKSLP
ncbi:hypothetical protein ACO0LB_16445 [Undibacterium sp. SXout7W]|uniref:hypothetical protein n=1 Tax=Undibacterium sp. SXout7W TaxID=3413049 RepID=UPI003BF312DB